MAVSNPGRGAKFSSARDEGEAFVGFPAAHTDNTRAPRTDVFRKSRFRAGNDAVPVEVDGNLHGNAAFGAVKGMSIPGGRDGHASSQARGDAREILYAASAMVLHAIKSAVGGPEQFFGGVAVFGIGGDAGADRERRGLAFGGQAFADAADDASGDVGAGLGKHEGKFIAAVAGGRVDGAR